MSRLRRRRRIIAQIRYADRVNRMAARGSTTATDGNRWLFVLRRDRWWEYANRFSRTAPSATRRRW
jgi:hypothetical protein